MITKRDTRKRRVVNAVIVILLAVAVSNCTTFQSPKVLEAGEISGAFGAAVDLQNSDFPLWFDAFVEVRAHAVDRLDIGFRGSFNFFTGNAIVDAKYQIVDGPFLLATSIGAGIIYDIYNQIIPSDLVYSDDPAANIRPWAEGSVILGAEVFHVGYRLVRDLCWARTGHVIFAGTIIPVHDTDIWLSASAGMTGPDLGYGISLGLGLRFMGTLSL